MLATSDTEKPPAVDEIFDVDHTDRRITRRIDVGTRLFGTSVAGNEEVSSFIVELISNGGDELEPDNRHSANCCADSYITHEQLCSPEGMT